MYYRQKFTDIVCALYRAKMKNLCSGSKVYTAIFHRSRVLAACGIHGNGFCYHFFRQRQNGVLSVSGWILKNIFDLFCFIIILWRAGCKGFLSRLQCRKAFIFCTWSGLSLFFTFIPTAVNSRFLAFPDSIIFFSC